MGFEPFFKCSFFIESALFVFGWNILYFARKKHYAVASESTDGQKAGGVKSPNVDHLEKASQRKRMCRVTSVNTIAGLA